MARTIEGRDVPLTGPRAGTHEQARAAARRAGDALKSVEAGKHAVEAPDVTSPTNAFDKNAAKVKRGGPWVDGHRDQKSGVTRTS